MRVEKVNLLMQKDNAFVRDQSDDQGHSERDLKI